MKVERIRIPTQRMRAARRRPSSSSSDRLGEGIETRAQKRTHEEVVFAVHAPIAIHVLPPTSTDKATVAGTELGLKPGRAASLQLLVGRTFDERDVRQDDRVLRQTLAGHIDRPRVGVGVSLASGHCRRGKRGHQHPDDRKHKQASPHGLLRCHGRPVVGYRPG